MENELDGLASVNGEIRVSLFAGDDGDVAVEDDGDANRGGGSDGGDDGKEVEADK